MRKLISSQVININGWQSINCLASWYSLPLVLVWLPPSFLEDFKYSEVNYFSAGYTKYNLLGVRENEQPKKAKFGSGNFGCLFMLFSSKSKSEQTTNLSSRGVAS